MYILNVHVRSCCFIVTSDMTCDETDQGVGPEEETLIQEVVHRLDDPSTPSTRDRYIIFSECIYIV